MNKKLLLIFVLLLCFFSRGKAQTYTIPWATQQPAWVFPLWFENGDGQKDTIYIGYDTSAHVGGFYQYQNPDTIFGEKCMTEDFTNFHVGITSAFLCDTVGNDTFGIIKCQVEPFYSLGDSMILVHIGIVHHVYPITIRWDVGSLHDATLPFHTCSTCPKAIGFIQDDFGYSLPVMACQPPFGDKIPFTDSTTEPCGTTKDSIVFIAGDSFNSMGIQSFIFKRWASDSLFVGLREPENSTLNIFPNPFKDELTINFNGLMKEIKIVNIEGKMVMDRMIIDRNLNELQLSNLADGIYILTIKTNNEIINKLIIKN